MTSPPSEAEGSGVVVRNGSHGGMRKAWELAGGLALAAALALSSLLAVGFATRNSGLRQAVSQSDLRRTELFLAIGANPNLPDPAGGSLLLEALQAEQPRIALALLRKGADPNKARTGGMTPLMSVEDPKVAAELLARGADASARDNDGNTALVWATVHGHAEVAALLLDAGADVNVRGALGVTPLILAASDGHTALVKLLLDRSADPALATTTGYTALTAAIENGNREVIQCIREALPPQIGRIRSRTATQEPPSPRSSLPGRGTPPRRGGDRRPLASLP